MKYNEFLKETAKANNTTPEKVITEMQNALKLAGLDCSPEEFIAIVSKEIKQRKNRT